MRFLTCLSQNVSVVLEERRTRRRKLALSFKEKKRRPTVFIRQTNVCERLNNAYERSPSAGHDTLRNIHSGQCAGDNERIQSSLCHNECRFLQDKCSNCEHIKNLHAGNGAHTVCCLSGPDSRQQNHGRLCFLPPAPELSTDYLPSFVVCSPFKEDDEESITTTESSISDEAPVWRSLQPPGNYWLGSDSGVTCRTYDIDGSTGTNSLSCDSASQTSSGTCSIASENSDVISSVNSVSNFNQAFIQSTASLPLKTRDSGVISNPSEIDKDRQKLIGLNVHSSNDGNGKKASFPQNENGRKLCVSHSDVSYTRGSELDCPSYSVVSVESFKKNVMKTPDPNDSLDEDYEKSGDGDTEVDIENISSSSSASEFLGCMSFGVGHLLKKDIDGWYYLLTEEVGRKKHLQAHNKFRPVLTTRNYQNIPQLNRAVDGHEKIEINIIRGKNGFGFSFVDEFPPKVGRVDMASPAELAGVKKGDLVIKINGQNVSRSTCEGVANLVKKINPSALRLELRRNHNTVSETTEITATGSQHIRDTSPYNKRGVGTSTDNLYESIEENAYSDHHKENRAVAPVYRSFADDYLSDDEFSYSQSRVPSHHGVTSTPRLFVAPGHKAVSSAALYPLCKHESIHRLMSLELDYIDFMHYGIERYSRPLRHSILSTQHHTIIFQNVEKLVTISEYHTKQMQENNSSINSDTDDSQSSESSMFPNSVALIYHSKIHMLGQAYEAYASGLSKSNAMLRELRRNQDFMNFIRERDVIDEQCADHPSVSAFINRPVLHIQELYSVLGEIFSSTPIHSPDFANLQQIVIKLSQCISTITGLSYAGRVESLDSLTSSKGKGSIASLSSTCSSSEADVFCPLVQATPLRSIDKKVRHIQKKLVFAPGVQAFQVAQEGRNLVYKGEIYRCSKLQWFKSQLILFSDMLLVVNQEPDGSLCATSNPISVQKLAGIEVNRKYASEFVLYINESASATVPRRHQSSSSASTGRCQTITLRAPSVQEKLMWKSLLEQQVVISSGGRLQHYGSMKDISNAKTSIIL